MKSVYKLITLFFAASSVFISASPTLADPMPEWEWDGEKPLEVAQADDMATSEVSQEESTALPIRQPDQDIEPVEVWIDIPVNGTKTLDQIDIETFVKALEADRELLVELRKDLPQDREEAEIYLHRLKYLTALSDPVRLVPLMNRVMEYSPLYFSWLVTEFENQEAQIIEYYIGGARSFHFALEKYQSMALFIIVNRLEIAARAIRELDMLIRQKDDE